MFIHMLLHTVKSNETGVKTFFTKLLKDVEPKSIETRCSMQANATDDSIQQHA